MSTSEGQTQAGRSRMRGILLIVVILVVAVAVAGGLAATRRSAQPEQKDTTKPVILVEVMALSSGEVTFTVDSQGTVVPHTETALSAEVAGTVIGVAPGFVPGGLFDAGEELLRIDPTNYRIAVAQAEALLRQRQVEVDGARSLKDKGYSAVANVAAAEAALAAANAGLERARADLARTSIRLPFAGMVRARDANLGQYVAPGTRLGSVFATDYAEVRLPLPDHELAFVALPGPGTLDGVGDNGLDVALAAPRRNLTARRAARITRTEGVIDERSRVTYAVARIDDPYALNAGDGDGLAPLPIGTFVQAAIAGETFSDIIRVPRAALRGDNSLLFIDENDRLQVRRVEVLRTDSEYAYLSGGASAGERICLTAIESPVNGMKVRTAPVETAPTETESNDAPTIADTVR